MGVMLDGRPIAARVGGESLAALLQLVRRDLTPARLIVEVEHNGELLADDALLERLPQILRDGDQIEIATAQRADVAADALRDMAEHIDAIGRRQPELAEAIHAGRSQQALNDFGDFLRVWQTVQRGILDCCELVGRDLTLTEFDGRPVREHVADLVHRLQELYGAIEARDFVMLADLMSVELPALCESWCRLLNEQADRVACEQVGDAG